MVAILSRLQCVNANNVTTNLNNVRQCRGFITQHYGFIFLHNAGEWINSSWFNCNVKSLVYVQVCSISSALSTEILQSLTKPSIWCLNHLKVYCISKLYGCQTIYIFHNMHMYLVLLWLFSYFLYRNSWRIYCRDVSRVLMLMFKLHWYNVNMLCL